MIPQRLVQEALTAEQQAQIQRRQFVEEAQRLQRQAKSYRAKSQPRDSLGRFKSARAETVIAPLPDVPGPSTVPEPIPAPVGEDQKQRDCRNSQGVIQYPIANAPPPEPPASPPSTAEVRRAEAGRVNQIRWAKVSIVLLFDTDNEFRSAKRPGCCSGRAGRVARRWCWRRLFEWVATHRTVKDITRTALQIKEVVELVFGALGGAKVVIGAAASAATVLVAYNGGAEQSK
jgi:hypothetical protein